MIVRFAILVEGLIMIAISRVLFRLGILLSRPALILVSYGYFDCGSRRIEVAFS